MLQNDLYETLLDYIPLKVYVVDIETYKVIYTNPAMRDSLYAPEAKKCFEIFFGQKKECSWCNMNELTQNKGHNYTREFFDETDDKWYISQDRYLSWSNGRNFKYSILTDITEQKENEGKLIYSNTKLAMHIKHLTNTNKKFQIGKLLLQKKSDELSYINTNLESTVNKQLLKLRKQDQMIFIDEKQASLDNIMSIISHQWKQPLNELSINNIYLAEKNKILEYKEIYKDNDEIIQFLSSTINVFQDFYKSSDKNKFYIEESIKSTILILNSSIRQYNIIIFFNCEDEKIEINGQKNFFSQVILIILENSINISIERNIEQLKLKINIKIITNYVILSIEDNCGGIEEEKLPYIFENNKSFRKKKSSGMGLYIANLIIEKFNGKISAKNTPEGIIFTIAIPL